MYHIKVEQAAKLKGKLALVDCECADVFLAEEGSYLVTNTMEAFCYVPLGAEASQGEGAHSFRINRKLLMSLLADGEMVVTFEENGIRIVFLTPEGTRKFDVVIPEQIVFSQSYADKVALCSTSELQQYELVDLTVCAPFKKCWANSPAIVSFSNGYVATDLAAFKVFRKLESPIPAMSLASKSLAKVIGFGKQVVSARDYLVAEADGVYFLVTKCRGFQNDELAFVDAGKSKLRAAMDLENLLFLLQDCKFEGEKITLDFSAKEIQAGTTGYQLNIPLHLTQYAAAPEAEPVSLPVPVSIIRLFGVDGGGSCVELSMKRNFNVLAGPNYKILF